jgi:hypothetical protein
MNQNDIIVGGGAAGFFYSDYIVEKKSKTEKFLNAI